MSGELITAEELQSLLRDEVSATGGHKKWGRKHSNLYRDYAYHMYEDGRMATNEEITRHLGYERVILYRKL